MLYAQNLVALSANRSQILFQKPASPATSNVAGFGVSGGVSGVGPKSQSKNQNRSVPYKSLSICMQRVEWRGDFVAMPLKPGVKNNSGLGVPATFAKRARK